MYVPLDKALEMLGVESGASEREVKRAYRRLAVKCHPDHGGDEEEFKKVTEAYAVIKIAMEHNWSMPQQPPPGMSGEHYGAGVSPEGSSTSGRLSPFDLYKRIVGGQNPEVDRMMNDMISKIMREMFQ